MAIEIPKDLAEGDPWPGASFFNQLLAALRRLRPVIGAESGLAGEVTPLGTRYRIQNPDRAKLAYTTSTITVRTGTDPNFTFGKGTAHLLDVTVGAAAVATSKGRPTAITVYHAGPTNTVPAGHVVQLKWIDNVPFIDTDYC